MPVPFCLMPLCGPQKAPESNGANRDTSAGKARESRLLLPERICAPL